VSAAGRHLGGAAPPEPAVVAGKHIKKYYYHLGSKEKYNLKDAFERLTALHCPENKPFNSLFLG